MKFIKENLRVFVAVFIALILIVVGIILILINNNANLGREQKQKEEELVEVTGMSGNDAIEVVKQSFNDDNYCFSVEVTNDSLYKVKAVSKFNNNEIVYFVDPVNGKTYVDIDTK